LTGQKLVEEKGMSNFKATMLMFLLAMTIFSSVYLAGSNLLPVSAQSSTSSGPTITWETLNTPQFIDPQVSYFSYDYGIMQNVYEPLLWYNGTCSTCVLPWLAQGYTTSPDLKTYQFTLRSGMKFADGENVDSTSVYFALNRALVMDGSTPVGHGTQASWILQQLLNTSLATTLGGHPTYNSAYVDSVLAQNFVSITSPTTFTINVMNPNSAFPYLLTIPAADPVAPNYVMQHDLALWNQSSTGYKLPYPSLSSAPDEMTMIKDYFYDEVATCNSGITPAGCGTTYMDHAYQGSLAGSGPYSIQSVGETTNDIVFTANPNYWGGPYPTKITPVYQTAIVNYVADQATREIDLRNAASSGQAMTVDLTYDHLYDVADRSLWLNSHQLQSTVSGVTLYGPYTGYVTNFDPFDMNVTNIFTGKPYTFQPFADRRFRLAFADAVNMTSIVTNVANGVGEPAINVISPGLPPPGAYNPNNTPAYSYNPDAVQNLLLDAMMHPLTSFTLENGNPAPAGTYNNTFGCSTLSSSGTCTSPVPQSITLVAPTGDTVDIDVMNAIAGTVNNVSSTYNMGLTVTVEPIPVGTMITEAFSGNLYMYALGWLDDYPWAIDYLGPMYAPAQTYPGPDGWNIAQMGTLYKDAVSASARGDLATIVSDTNAMNTLANQAVMYLWTWYPAFVEVFTSNIQGFFWNPSTIVDGPYFASYSPTTMTSTTSTSAAASSSTLIMVAGVVVVIIIVAIAAVVLRSRGKKTKT
jgi:ABC-type transport system substrate-binding protein